MSSSCALEPEASSPENASPVDLPSSALPDIEEEDTIERVYRLKKEEEQIVQLFRQNPKRAVAHLINTSRLGTTAKDLATYFHTNHRQLCKISIGKLLAYSDAFYADVLQCYVEGFDFCGLEIDAALRLFMSKFKMIGEAQIVDRTMMIFSQKYYRDNVSSSCGSHFATADTAYVLSFSIMMLNTDAHNPAIVSKDKMTRDQFLSMNRGINDGKDLPSEYLEGIYQRITGNEIRLEGSGYEHGNMTPKEGSRRPVAVRDATRDRWTSFMEETRSMQQRTREILLVECGSQRSTSLSSSAAFFVADRVELIKPIFEICWAPMLAAFSVMLESQEEEYMIGACLEGFERAIHICCLFHMTLKREAYMTGLCKFTHLTNMRMIDTKSMKCIRKIIDIAMRNGAGLGTSWFQILRCISQLEKLHLIGSAHNDIEIRLVDAPADTQGTQLIAHYERVNAEIVSESIQKDIVDRIYVQSSNLSGRSIVDFVACLCRVSYEEIELSVPPRLFSLARLVEIAEGNMTRIRLVWGQIWLHLAQHFVFVGTHKQLNLALFAVDALRQLALKFLSENELRYFHFQRDVLKPFEKICLETPYPEVKELVVRCIENIIMLRSTHILSGWSTLLHTLSQVSSEKHDKIVFLTYDVLLFMNEHCLDSMMDIPPICMDYVNFLGCLCFNRTNDGISYRCLDLLVSIYQKLAPVCFSSLSKSEYNLGNRLPNEAGGESTQGETTSLFPNPSVSIQELSSTSHVITPEDERNEETTRAKIWFSILSNVVSVATDHHSSSVKEYALRQLFSILHACAHFFSENMWRLVFASALFPFFDHIFCAADFDAFTPSLDDHAMEHVRLIELGLSYLVELFLYNSAVLLPMLMEVLEEISQCVLKPNRAMSNLGLRFIHEIIIYEVSKGKEWERRRPEGFVSLQDPIVASKNRATDAHYFESFHWSIIRDEIANLYEETLPRALLSVRLHPQYGFLYCSPSGCEPHEGLAQQFVDTTAEKDNAFNTTSQGGSSQRSSVGDMCSRPSGLPESHGKHDAGVPKAASTHIHLFIEKSSHASTKRRKKKACLTSAPTNASKGVWRRLDVSLIVSQLDTISILMQCVSNWLTKLVYTVEPQCVQDLLECFLGVFSYTCVYQSDGNRLTELESRVPSLNDAIRRVQRESIEHFLCFASKLFPHPTAELQGLSFLQQATPPPSEEERAASPGKSRSLHSLCQTCGNLLFYTSEALLVRFTLLHRELRRSSEDARNAEIMRSENFQNFFQTPDVALDPARAHLPESDGLTLESLSLKSFTTSFLEDHSMSPYLFVPCIGGQDVWEKEFSAICTMTFNALGILAELPSDIFSMWMPSLYGSLCAALDAADPTICHCIQQIFLRLGKETLHWIKAAGHEEVAGMDPPIPHSMEVDPPLEAMVHKNEANQNEISGSSDVSNVEEAPTGEDKIDKVGVTADPCLSRDVDVSSSACEESQWDDSLEASSVGSQHAGNRDVYRDDDSITPNLEDVPTEDFDQK